ncbi:hypothetical protein [Mesorhizobium sp.]|uniref:hypothetical protein n=1 Tax=Mesorhizobium sp. TaxID=1871066 RepID=UPI000FE49610|nr:hypothetical protein [Mesorhizobium sp.]RWM75511.1 MAG: hypothetical protein EOR82_02365 [Mesorhizobium sp.]TIO23340.1 MAG: hypothetical protein E5X83_21825 [Mesorhizobium sp.]TJV61457.1 MAG: hypothetical protein E5X82_11680 [Mesorhizobium sp.]
MITRLLTVVFCASIAGITFLAFSEGSNLGQPPRTFGWADIPAFSMAGGLKAFWNVGDGTKGEAAKNAYARGFEPVTILNTYADYPGEQRENISKAIGDHHVNPWQRPPFFERIIRRNIEQTPVRGIYVHDIELPFEENTKVAWEDQPTQQASGTESKDSFDEAYFRQWAEWFWLPLKWTKERYPNASVGLYGVQPFRRDYWGISDKNAAQIDGTHKSDWRMWKYIEPYVNFYTASVYVFYDRPDSVFYIATNVEENYRRTRSLGDKPVYAYEWLRFHDSNIWLREKELPSYLVEAMAIVPYFSGAKGVVLWGWEPQVKTGTQQPYGQLSLYVRSLKRVAMLSKKIARGRLLNDPPAHELWKAHRPLIRRVMVDENECVVMAINPWQGDNERSIQPVQCGSFSSQIVLEGRHTTLVVLNRQGERAY